MTIALVMHPIGRMANLTSKGFGQEGDPGASVEFGTVLDVCINSTKACDDDDSSKAVIGETSSEGEKDESQGMGDCVICFPGGLHRSDIGSAKGAPIHRSELPDRDVLMDTQRTQPSHDAALRKVQKPNIAEYISIQTQPEVQAPMTEPEIMILKLADSINKSNDNTFDEIGLVAKRSSEKQTLAESMPVLAGNRELEPVFSTPAATQVLTQISSVFFETIGEPAPSPSVVSTAHQLDTPQSEVKLLRFMLQPEELGEVEVALRHMRHETLVTITVSDRAAAEAVNRDMAALEDRLGGLLSTAGSGSVTVSLEVRRTESELAHSAQPSGGYGFDAAALLGGRSSSREGRSNSNEHRSPVSMSRTVSHEKEAPSEPVLSNRRVV